jgi:tetratricopeptide (TPR) repeat protein
MKLQEKLDQGIAAAEGGRRAEARILLNEVVQADENQLEAWLWLSQVVDSLEDQAVCLENVLTLDPDNEFALQQLAWVKQRQEELVAPVYALGEEEPPPQVVPPPEPPLEIRAEYPHQPDEFDDPWLCPYCVTPTRPEDRRCTACHHSLIVRVRVKEERTVWLWRGIFLQFAIAFILLVSAIIYFTAVAKLMSDISNPFPFLPIYFGLPVDQPVEQVETILTLFPLWAFWGVVAFTLYSLLLMLMLYFRMPNGHVFYLTNAGIMLVLGILGSLGAIFFLDSFSGPLLVASIIVLLVGLMQLIISMNLWDDFTFEETRLRLTLDRDARGHTGLFISGRRYGELGMWGRAVIHLRRAAAKEEKPLYYIALVVAYMNIKRYDLAQEALTKAEALDPHSPKIEQLKSQLAARL